MRLVKKQKNQADQDLTPTLLRLLKRTKLMYVAMLATMLVTVVLLLGSGLLRRDAPITLVSVIVAFTGWLAYLLLSWQHLQSLVRSNRAILLEAAPERALAFLLGFVGHTTEIEDKELLGQYLNGLTPEQLKCLSPQVKQRLRNALTGGCSDDAVSISSRVALIRAIGRMEDTDAVFALEMCALHFNFLPITYATKECLATLRPLAEKANPGKMLLRAGMAPAEHQQAVLLRAATKGQEMPAEQLVRPIEKQE